MAPSACLTPSFFSHLLGVLLRPPEEGTADRLISSSEASEGGGESWSAGGVRRPGSIWSGLKDMAVGGVGEVKVVKDEMVRW